MSVFGSTFRILTPGIPFHLRVWKWIVLWKSHLGPQVGGVRALVTIIFYWENSCPILQTLAPDSGHFTSRGQTWPKRDTLQPCVKFRRPKSRVNPLPTKSSFWLAPWTSNGARYKFLWEAHSSSYLIGGPIRTRPQESTNSRTFHLITSGLRSPSISEMWRPQTTLDFVL